jgi:kelch-like protein 20/kelch-like protein 24/35
VFAYDDSFHVIIIIKNSHACAEVPPLKMAVTSPAVVAYEGSLFVTGGAILEDGDGIELVQR